MTTLLTEEAVSKNYDSDCRRPDLATMDEAAVEQVIGGPRLTVVPPPPPCKPDLVFTSGDAMPEAPHTEPTVAWNEGHNR